MKYLIAIITGLFFIQASAQHFQLAKGTVFHDENNNRIIDEGEKGVPGVMVSNQETVVLTDENGYYELPVDSQTTIFITKPAGYEVPLNQLNLPQYYYIHQPAGSPDMDYPGIKPTGKLPSHINFSLHKTQETDTFKMLALADVQVAGEEETGYFRKDVVEAVLKKNFDIVVSLGDLVHDDLSLFRGYNQSMALLDAPVYNVLGNHDVNYDADEPFSSDTYKSLFGPNYYSFDRGQVHFVVLDNIYRTCKEGEAESHWNCYKGYVDEKQLKWLENDLKYVSEDKLVVICQHIAFEKNTQRTERMSVTNRDELFDVLKERDNLLVLAGHKHTLQHDYLDNSEDWHGSGKVHQIVCSSVSGSWWTGPKDERNIPSSTQIDGVPNGYFIFEFNGKNFIHSYYPAGNLNEQMRIELPPETISEEDVEIVVNVYNSSENSKIVAEIEGFKPIELKNQHGKDPFIEKSFDEFRDDYKSWASPSVSTQLWKGKLPKNLESGWHKLKVTAKDDYGRAFTSYAVFEVR